MADSYVSTDRSLRQLNDFAFDFFSGVDLNSATETLDLTTDIPRRADTISVFAEPTGDVSVELVFYETEDANNEIGRITSSENTDLTTAGGNTLVADTVVVSPYIQVEFIDDSGVANSTNGSVYVR
jgi:hypothetical protein